MFNYKTIEAARKRRDEIIADYKDVAEETMTCLDEGFEAAMTLMIFPEYLRKYFLTSNQIKLLNEERIHRALKPYLATKSPGKVISTWRYLSHQMLYNWLTKYSVSRRRYKHASKELRLETVRRFAAAVDNIIDCDFHAEKPNLKWLARKGFFGHFKTEMFYNRSWKGVSSDEFIRCFDDYMNWYCRDRIKSRLGGLSPLNYRRMRGVGV